MSKVRGEPFCPLFRRNLPVSREQRRSKPKLCKAIYFRPSPGTRAVYLRQEANGRVRCGGRLPVRLQHLQFLWRPRRKQPYSLRREQTSKRFTRDIQQRANRWPGDARTCYPKKQARPSLFPQGLQRTSLQLHNFPPVSLRWPFYQETFRRHQCPPKLQRDRPKLSFNDERRRSQYKGKPSRGSTANRSSCKQRSLAKFPTDVTRDFTPLPIRAQGVRMYLNHREVRSEELWHTSIQQSNPNPDRVQPSIRIHAQRDQATKQDRERHFLWAKARLRLQDERPRQANPKRTRYKASLLLRKRPQPPARRLYQRQRQARSRRQEGNRRL